MKYKITYEQTEKKFFLEGVGLVLGVFFIIQISFFLSSEYDIISNLPREIFITFLVGLTVFSITLIKWIILGVRSLNRYHAIEESGKVNWEEEILTDGKIIKVEEIEETQIKPKKKIKTRVLYKK